MLVAALWKYNLDQWGGKHFKIGWANSKQETRKKKLQDFLDLLFSEIWVGNCPPYPMVSYAPVVLVVVWSWS